VALVVVAVVGFIVAGILFGDGLGGDGEPSGFDVGPADEYARGDVNYFEDEHVLLTRLADGSFIALYDKSTKQQELGSDCRLFYDETASLGALPPLEGIRGAIVEECEGTRGVWRADGVKAGGAGYGDLDRFNTATNSAGDLIIDTSQRTCTRSRGVIGQEPYDVKTCNGNP
jgi:hypothetical protein